MKDARYFRARAQLCIEIARQMSDRSAADQFLVKAAENLARATEQETQSRPPVSQSPAMMGCQRESRDFANDESKSEQPHVWNKTVDLRVIRTKIGQPKVMP